jgi:hypothetical protein
VCAAIRSWRARVDPGRNDDHLFFAHIHSAQTVENIRLGSHVDINLVDPFSRKGYRSKGPAVIHEQDSQGVATGIERLRREGHDGS